MPSSPSDVLVTNAGRSSASTISTDMETGSHELTVSGYSGSIGLMGVGHHVPSIQRRRAQLVHPIYYPDGGSEESADWISVYLQLGNQVSDGNVIAQIRFSLLEQMGEPVPSYTVTSDKKDLSAITTHSWGWPKFIKRKELEESPHIEGDSFRISCHVTVFKIRVEETPVQFPATAPSTDLHRNLGDLLESKVGADVKLRVGQETFWAHRCVLAARSPVFKAELFGWMQEKKTAEVRIVDMEPRAFGAMLHFIYTDSLPEIDEGDRRVMAQHLLVMADRYRLERLNMICEDMLRNYIDTTTVATTLALAEQHGCRHLKERCLNFFRNPGNTMAVMATDGFEHLMSSFPSLVKDLLSKVAP
ncbi:unnamed protein product [Urochloa decumbens]|uniref:BTB domain-containing protein n=1 Tax=Urochloa decumbens TaxID=240449 RepID=A0ABC9AJ43_9POAL